LCCRPDEMPMSAAVAQAYDEQQHKQQMLAHQHSMSQDEQDLDFTMVTELLPGCVAPAPTPAPSIAPLAELDADPPDDDVETPTADSQLPSFEVTAAAAAAEQKPEVERKKKRREKKDKEGAAGQTEATSSTDPDKSKRNAVCPWEDE